MSKMIRDFLNKEGGLLEEFTERDLREMVRPGGTYKRDIDGKILIFTIERIKNDRAFVVNLTNERFVLSVKTLNEQLKSKQLRQLHADEITEEVSKVQIGDDPTKKAKMGKTSDDTPATPKIPPQKGDDPTNKTAIGKTGEVIKQEDIPPQTGEDVTKKTPATKSQRDAEKEKDLANLDVPGSGSKDTPIGTEPKQKGNLPGNAPVTKSQKKGDEPSKIQPKESKDDSKGVVPPQQGEEPKVVAGKTKTTDKADKKPGEDPEEIKDNKKLKEQEEEPVQIEDEPKDDPIDEPPEEDAPKVEPEEITPEKEYFGNKEDEFYYLVRILGNGNNIEDLQITNAEGETLYAAKENELDVNDLLTFILRALENVPVEAVAYEIVNNYVLPALEKKDEEEELPPKEEEPKEEKKPEEEPIEAKKEKVLDSKSPEEKAAQLKKSKDILARLIELDAPKVLIDGQKAWIEAQEKKIKPTQETTIKEQHEETFEIMFNNLDSATQENVLDFYDINSPDEGNFDVMPLAFLYKRDDVKVEGKVPNPKASTTDKIKDLLEKNPTLVIELAKKHNLSLEENKKPT